MGDELEVVQRYKQIAVELLKDPDSPSNISDQLTLLMARGNRNPAHLALAKRAESLAPYDFIPVFNLGNAQVRAGHYLDALATLQRALKLVPPSHLTIALNDTALAYYDLGQFQKCIDRCDAMIAQGLADKITHENRALAVLATGDLANGLFGFECKHYRAPRKPIASSGIPRWMGEPLEGKRVIVHHEQGYGDCIMFSRFLPRVRAGRVTFAGPPELLPLLQKNFHADEWVGEEGPFEGDYYCSLMSAAGAMRITYADIAGDAYLKSDTRILPGRGKLKIGLAWRGSSSYVQDTNRSMDLEDLCPLFELPGASYYSLQVGSAAKDISRLGLDGFIPDLTPAFRDWSDTARAIMAMDVVVSVDTAVAHLAGALGKPTLLFLPFACCWRWRREGDTTPWYKSARLFRQEVPLDWRVPVQRVKKAIEGMI